MGLTIELQNYILSANRMQLFRTVFGHPDSSVGKTVCLCLTNDHLFGKELFILNAASAFRKLSSIYVFSYFPFGFEGRIWDLIVSVPDHCLSFYFVFV